MTVKLAEGFEPVTLDEGFEPATAVDQPDSSPVPEGWKPYYDYAKSGKYIPDEDRTGFVLGAIEQMGIDVGGVDESGATEEIFTGQKTLNWKQKLARGAIGAIPIPGAPLAAAALGQTVLGSNKKVPRGFGEISKSAFGREMTVEEAEKELMGRMAKIYDETPLQAFDRQDPITKGEIARTDENKRRKSGRKTTGDMGTNEPRLNMPGVDYSRFGKDQQDIPAGDEEQTAQAIEARRQDLFAESAGDIFRMAQSVLTRKEEMIGQAMINGAQGGGEAGIQDVVNAHADELLNMDDETIGYMKAYVVSQIPEEQRNFFQRILPSATAQITSRFKNTAYSAREMGIDMLGLSSDADRIGKQVETGFRGVELFDEDGAVLPEHADKLRLIIRNEVQSNRIEGGLDKASQKKIEDYYFNNFGKVVSPAIRQAKLDRLRYGVKALAAPQYNDLGFAKETALTAIGTTVDMAALAVIQRIPVVGVPFVMGTTYGSFQGDLEQRLMYEHDMPLSQARMTSAIAAVPYAMSEYSQAFTLGKAPSLLPFIGEKNASRIFLHEFSNYARRAMWPELREEYLQAGINYAAMETARVFADSKGITFDDNVKRAVQDAVQATLIMPFVTIAGGGSVSTAKAIGSGSMRNLLPEEFKRSFQDIKSPVDVYAAAQNARRKVKLMDDQGVRPGQYPKKLTEAVRLLDQSEKTETGNTNAEESEADLMETLRTEGYEDPDKALDGIRLQIQHEDALQELTKAKVNHYRSQLDSELSQGDTTDVSVGPKMGLVQGAMDTYGAALGVSTETFATQAEALAAYPELKVAKGEKIKAVNLDGKRIVVVEENLTTAQDALGQWWHEVGGHRGLDINPKAQRFLNGVKSELGMDFIKSQLPAFYHNQSDNELVGEYLSRLVGRAGQSGELGVTDQEKGVWKRFKEWAGADLGLDLPETVAARSVARTAKDILTFAKQFDVRYPDGMSVKLERKTFTRTGGQWLNEKGRPVKDAGLVETIQTAADESAKKIEDRKLKSAKIEAEKRIQQMADADPVIKMVLENGKVEMPEMKPGQPLPDEYAAIPKRFRAAKGLGMPLDQLADQVAALSGQTADYSTDQLREALEAFDAKAESLLQQAADGRIQSSAHEEQVLIDQLDRGEISQQEYDQAMAEVSGARFSVEQMSFFDDLQKKAAPEARKLFEDVKASPQVKDQKKIDDFGEKIGGARKDLADRGFKKGGKVEKDSRPAWRKDYVVSLIDKSTDKNEEGRYVIYDSTRRDYMGNMRQAFPKTFAAEQDAENAIPLIEVVKKFRVYTEGGKHAIYKRVSDRKRIKVVNRSFDTEEEAKIYMAVHAAELLDMKTSFGEEILPIPEIAERIGEARRNGPATKEMFIETFAPRAIEFGNWNNQEERQQLMDHAYDGLLDLAEALSVPPKALMLNGDLAIAFGARGHGLSSARAHYEIDYGVINLTKEKGAGSLAHEWMHALDHYLARVDTKAPSEKVVNKRGDSVFKVSGDKYDLQSHGYSTRSKMRTELKEAYNDLVKSLFSKNEQFTEDKARADKFLSVARDELKNKLDSIRRYFEQDDTQYVKNRKPATKEQLAKFDVLAADLASGKDSELKWMAEQSRWSSDRIEDIGALYKAVKGIKGFSPDGHGSLDELTRNVRMYRQRQNILKDADQGAEKTRRTKTNFLIEAVKMDQARTGDYWAQEHEMLARAFSAYVEDHIGKSGNKSEYLVYHAHGGVFHPMIDGFVGLPYPEGLEREEINRAFDRFFSTVRTQDTEKGVAMFSIEQQEDPMRATAVHIAYRIFNGDFQVKRVAKGKNKGQLVARTDDEQLADISKLLESQGLSKSKVAAQEVLDDARAVAQSAIQRKQSLKSNQSVSKFIRDEATRQWFSRQVETIYREGQSGGKLAAAAEAEVRYQQEKASQTMLRTRPGLGAEELREYNLDTRHLLDKLELEEKKREFKPSEQRMTDDEFEQMVDSGKIPDMGVDGNASGSYRAEVDDFLFRVKTAVVRKLTKEGVLAQNKDLLKAMRSLVAVAEYRKTLQNVLGNTAAELTYGFRRDVIERKIRALDDARLMSTLDSKAATLLQQMFDARDFETLDTQVSKVLELTQKFGGRLKYRLQETSQAVQVRAIKMFRMIRGGDGQSGVLLMEPDAVQAEMEQLRNAFDDPQKYAPEGSDVEAWMQDAVDRYNMLDRFGAFKYKTAAERADAVGWLESRIETELKEQEERRAARKAEAEKILSALQKALPRRKTAGHGVRSIAEKFADSNSQVLFLEQRMLEIPMYGKDADRKVALKMMEKLAFDIAAANFHKNNKVAQDNRAFGEALQRIYGVRFAENELKALMDPQEAFQKFSLDGMRLSRSHVLQMLGMLAQNDIRSRAQTVAEIEAKLKAEHGDDLSGLWKKTKPEEVAQALWQSPDEFIKYRTAAGVELNSYELLQAVRGVVDGSKLARRLEMEPEMLRALREVSPQDFELLDWFRDYYRNNRTALSAVNKEVTGFVIQPPDALYIPSKVDYRAGAIRSVNIAMPVVPPSLTPRVFNTKDLDESADIVSIYMRRLESNEQFIHFAKLHQRVAGIFNDGELTRAIELAHGKRFADQLGVHLRDVLSNQPITGGKLEIIDSLTNFFAVTRLGWNLSLFPKQLTSLPAFAMYVKAGDFAKYVGSAFTDDGRAAMKEIWDSPHAKTRLRTGQTQVDRDILSGLNETGMTIWEWYKQKGRYPTMAGDVVPTLIFGQGYYRAMLDDASRQGMKQEEGKEWALDQLFRLVEMSQQSGSLINMAEWQRHGGSAGRAVGQFLSTPSQFWAKQVFDWREWRAAIEAEGKGSDRASEARTQFLKTSLINHVMLAGLYTGVNMLWKAALGDPPDKKDWTQMIESMAVGPWSGVLVVGAIQEGIVHGLLTGESSFGGGDIIPISGLAGDAQTLAAAFNALATGDFETMWKDLDRILAGMAPPYRDVRKAVKNYTE